MENELVALVLEIADPEKKLTNRLPLLFDALELCPQAFSLLLEVRPRLLVADVKELPLPRLLVVVVHPRH